MASQTPDLEPAPEAIVLYAGELASDDRLWVASATVPEIGRFVASPVAWVAGLGSLPGWSWADSGEPDPAPVLPNGFAVAVGRTATDLGGHGVLQGIGGTNALSLLARRATAIRAVLALSSVGKAAAGALGMTVAEALALPDAALEAAPGDPFAPLWEDAALDPLDKGRKREFLTVVLPALSRWYGHIEMGDPHASDEANAASATAFLLATAFDPEGYARMLDGLAQRAMHVGADGLREPGEPIRIRSGGPVAATYMGADGSAPATLERDDDPPSGFRCNMMDGEYHGPGTSEEGQGIPNQASVKWYGQESSGPPGG